MHIKIALSAFSQKGITLTQNTNTTKREFNYLFNTKQFLEPS
jgi:hypothetical protein